MERKFLKDSKKVERLTEREQVECTARWVGALYTGYWYLLAEKIDVKFFLEEVEKSTCTSGCPYYEKCPSTARDPYRPTIPIMSNFKILEKITGERSVLIPAFQLKDSQHKDTVPHNE